MTRIEEIEATYKRLRDGVYSTVGDEDELRAIVDASIPWLIAETKKAEKLRGQMIEARDFVQYYAKRAVLDMGHAKPLLTKWDREDAEREE